jgi:hypothetical protein
MADEPKKEGSDQEPGGVEKRIAQLTRQKHDATRRAEGAEAQTTALSGQIVSLQSTVDKLTSRLASPAQPAPAGDPLAALLGSKDKGDQTAQPAGQPVDIEAVVKSAVNEALAPLVEGRKQEAEAAQLAQAQSRSYQEAAKEFLPQALVDGSVEQSTFDAVFSRSPALQLDPDGPAIALAAVAGILSQGARTTQEQESKKQAATMPATVPNVLARIGDLPSGKADTKEAVQALAEKGQSQGLTTNELAAMIGLQTGRAKLTEE